MDGSALRGDADHVPAWADVRAAVMRAAEVAAVAVTDAMSRPRADWAAVQVAAEAVAELRYLGGCLRPLAFDEAVIDAEAERRAGAILAAAGLVPAGRRERHLHAVS